LKEKGKKLKKLYKKGAGGLNIKYSRGGGYHFWKWEVAKYIIFGPINRTLP
jgi:hypothetical protein